MAFFKQNGFDVEKDIIEEKIEQRAPLEDLFLIPIFLDELNFQNEKLIEYLKDPAIIKKMIWYLRVLAFPDQHSEHRCFHYPYFSYEVLSACNDEISNELISNEELLDNLFGISVCYNQDLYDTAFGYIQGALQNLISQNNSFNKVLIEKIQNGSPKYVYPFVAIMNKASAEYIFDIIGYLEEGFNGYKEELFNIVLRCFLEYSCQYPYFKSVLEEIKFWRDSFAKFDIQGIL